MHLVVQAAEIETPTLKALAKLTGATAIERIGEGAYLQAMLAGLVCVGCLAGIGWALRDRA